MSDDRETARVLRQAKLLGEDSLNDLDRWRLRHARDEEERAAQRRAEECAPQQRERQTTVDELRAEMADIRAETNRLHDVVLEAVGEVLGEGSNKTCDLIEKAVRDLQREMTASIARHYGELMGRIDIIAPEVRPRANKDFKFAAERDDGDALNDLPDPHSIVRKTTVN